MSPIVSDKKEERVEAVALVLTGDAAAAAVSRIASLEKLLNQSQLQVTYLTMRLQHCRQRRKTAGKRSRRITHTSHAKKRVS